LKQKMAPNGWGLFKWPIRNVFGLVTKGCAQSHRQSSDRVHRHPNEDSLNLDFSAWDPRERPGAVMMTWTWRMIVLLFGKTAVSQTVMIVASARRSLCEGRVVLDLMHLMPAAPKKRMATHR
jgi:hypothetical protein